MHPGTVRHFLELQITHKQRHIMQVDNQNQLGANGIMAMIESNGQSWGKWQEQKDDNRTRWCTTGFGNAWTVTTEGTWLLKKSQSSVVSWPDLVSTDQCFNRFASFISVSKWSEELSRNREPSLLLLSLSLSYSLSLPAPPPPIRALRFLTRCL